MVVGPTSKGRKGRGLLLRETKGGREERWDGKGGESNSPRVKVSRINTIIMKYFATLQSGCCMVERKFMHVSDVTIKHETTEAVVLKADYCKP